MAMIPAGCRSCGSVFGASNIFGGDMIDLQLTNVGVGPCPKCGGTGNVPDGVYNLRDDTVEVVQSAGIPPNVLQGIVGMLEALQHGQASTDQVLAEVEREAPALRDAVERALAHPNTAVWVAILIQIILGILTMTNQGPNAQEIAEELRAEPIPTYSVPAPPKAPPTAQARSRRKRPAKQFGKGKQSKSRKRR
jgi:hypothetical protein